MIYVPLYLYKDLVLTAVLYVGFGALCLLGLHHWRSERARDLASAVNDPAGPEPLLVDSP